MSRRLLRDVATRFGRIDVLANIAGGSFYTKRIEEFTWAEWKQVIDTNLKGTFLMCREVAPIMQRQKSGRILNTASNYAVTGSALRAPYSAAKAGIIAFTKSLALELAPDGIRVNTVRARADGYAAGDGEGNPRRAQATLVARDTTRTHRPAGRLGGALLFSHDGGE